MRKNITILVSLLILSHTACSDKGQYFEESGSVFHTSYHIKYKAKQILTDKIDSELQRFNLSLNPFNPNSTIAKVNNNEDVEVDEWFTEVFNKAEEISQKSGGAFDITCAPLPFLVSLTYPDITSTMSLLPLTSSIISSE